jgi:hypothetical protein
MSLSHISRSKTLSLFLILLGLALVATTVACGNRGSGERAGEKIDEAVEDTKDAVGDAVDNDGPIEEAGEKVDDKLD